MADFALRLEAPDRAWAEHVAALIQQGLGERGSVSVGLPGERLPDSPPAPGYVVTGVIVCNEPEDEMRRVILEKLVDYDVEVGPAPAGSTTMIVVRPPG